MQLRNGPFTSSSRLLFQSESKCEAFVTDIGFIRIERGIAYWNNLRTETFFEKEYEGNSEMLYSWFSLTWWDGHVGVENNGKMLLKFA